MVLIDLGLFDPMSGRGLSIFIKTGWRIEKTEASEFLDTPLRVTNFGLEGFAHELQEQGAPQCWA